MQTITLILIVFSLLVLLRFLCRTSFKFPKYKGSGLADGSGIKDLLPESEFWKIVENSLKQSNYRYGPQCELLTNELASFPEERIILFNRTLTTLMAKSYDFQLWEAAYSLNGGCSDDCFEYFRSWLISLGRNKFYWTLKYPRLLIFIGVKELIQNYEGIAYAAYDAYQYKTGREIPQTDGIEYADPGKIFNEDQAFFKYPELALLAW